MLFAEAPSSCSSHEGSWLVKRKEKAEVGYCLCTPIGNEFMALCGTYLKILCYFFVEMFNM